MEAPALLVPAFLLSAVLYLTFNLYQSWTIRQQLHKIPTIGPSGILSSYVGAYMFVKKGRQMIQEGYDKHRGSAFKVPGISKWMVIISGPEMLEDLRKATDDQVSSRDAANDVIQIDYTIGRAIHYDPYHVPVILHTLTRKLPDRFSDVQDEITTAFAEHIPVTQEWSKVNALPTIVQIISQTANRIFVGLPLCRDPDYRSLTAQLTMDVFKAATIINLFPNFLKPLAGPFFSKLPRYVRRMSKHLEPILQERFKQEEKRGKNWLGKPDDYLSWLLDVAQGKQRTVRDLTTRILAINFAAIQTTSMALTQVLFDLAAHPSYIAILREEAEEIIKEEGLNKTSLQKMRKLDSFIKESQRLGGTGTLAMLRKVLKDFTFSDGTVVPRGTTIAVARSAIHHDEELYRDSNRFDGLRFANLRDTEAEESSKHQMVSLSSEYIVFGHGRRPCPGRFMAVLELKSALLHVLLNYDVALEKPNERPQDRWFGLSSIPDPAASLMFRKRHA